jgi:two-component system NarL family response regulator
LRGPIRIAVADDHPVVREGLAAIIRRQADMVVVGEAVDGREALEVCLAHHPDVILMDLRMPVMDGVAATEAIQRGCPGTRVLVLTTYDGEEEVYQALRAGAKGYLLKDARREDLLEAIRSVHAGRRWIPVPVAARLADRVGAPELTAREKDVLMLIVRGRSNKEIGAALAITEGTVKGHVNNILGKLGVGGRTEAAIAAVQRGIVHPGEAPPR